MFIQQKLTPSNVSDEQAKMMALLPLILLFVFAQLPAGLVVYWTFSNIFSIGQQLAFNQLAKKNKYTKV